MNRKTFIQTSAVAILGGIAFPNLIACNNNKYSARTLLKALTVRKGDLSTVRGNVSRFTNRGGTVGILETSDGFLVIDAQFPDSIQPLFDSITKTEGKPIQFLCNTHHHGDHTAGNIVFKGKVNQIIAHNQVPIYQKLRAEENQNEDQQLYANTLFTQQKKIELGNELITAYHFGAAHTYGDAIYHFEKDNVVHMGDLVFNEVLPVYRVKDGSNIIQWISVLDKIITQFEDDTQFIFGHSYDSKLTTGTKSDLVNMQSFLEAANEFVHQEVLKNGKTPEEIATTFSFIPGYESRKPLWKSHWDDFIINLSNSVSQN